MAFTRAFYLSLLTGGTVNHSFAIAKQALKASPYVTDSALEGEKFILLPEPTVDRPDFHDIAIFQSKSQDQWPLHSQCTMSNHILPLAGNTPSVLSTSILTQPLPNTPPEFEGREVDIHQTIITLSARKLVTIVGDDGIGKSSVATAACNYLSDRCIFEDGIFYLRCQSIRTHVEFMKSLRQVLYRSTVKMNTRVKTISSTMSLLPTSRYGSNNTNPGAHSSFPMHLNTSESDSSMTDEMFQLEELVIACIGPLRCLLVFDHVNDLLRDDNSATDLRLFLGRLFNKCKHVKILVTSVESLLGDQQIGGLIEYTVPLGPLTLRDSLVLFAKLTPTLLTSQQKLTFVSSMIPPKTISMSRSSLQSTSTSNGSGSQSSLHPVWSKLLTLLGDGHPGVIVKMASEYDAEAVDRLMCDGQRIIQEELDYLGPSIGSDYVQT